MNFPSTDQEKEIVSVTIQGIKTTQDRLLDHHKEFRERFDSIDSKFSDLIDIIHKESNDRRDSIAQIKDELHGRINTILFSILGGAGLFVMGIIMWLVEKHN